MKGNNIMRRGLKTPNNCAINFEFSFDRIECKLCKYFNICLNIFTRAHKLAKNIY